MRPEDRWERARFVADVNVLTDQWSWRSQAPAIMRHETRRLAARLDDVKGATVQDRWARFETGGWAVWQEANSGRRDTWRWGMWAAVLTRTVRAAMGTIDGRVVQWIAHLPPTDPFAMEAARLEQLIGEVRWAGAAARRDAFRLGLRVLLAAGLERVDDLSEAQFNTLAIEKGATVLDAALVHGGVFDRGAQHSSTRHRRVPRRTNTELVSIARIPDRFREVTIAYLNEYEARVGAVYSTIRGRSIALGHWWRYIDTHHPDVRSCAEVRSVHARGFHDYAQARAVERRRNLANDDGVRERGTAYVWVGAVRLFFADLTTWAAEDGSGLGVHVPPTNPLGVREQHALKIGKLKQQRAAAVTATVIELERELPKVRAFAYAEWDRHRNLPRVKPTVAEEAEWKAFWSWALLELLVQSGLRIEEALDLTTLDVLRRETPNGARYYLLHVKPSKYDRARVVPIGDGLGRVIAEIVRHVRAFYNGDTIPAQRTWCSYEKKWRPAAPYLFQGVTGHPSVVDHNTVRGRLARLAEGAQIARADGTRLTLRPHDCRRMFASEHLNNSTPVHVIQALLGHASIETVMIYAKLYPTTLVEEYRKTVYSLYQAHVGEDAFRPPTIEEWRALDESCVMRDMGTHLCALPLGQHCPKGLVCLGCGHAQPKRSARPVFVRMLSSHERALQLGREHGEPAGQLAAREMEIARISGALRRIDALSDEVATAMELT